MVMCPKDAGNMANSVDPDPIDQTADMVLLCSSDYIQS